MAQLCDLETLVAGGAPWEGISEHEQFAITTMLTAENLHFQTPAIPEDIATLLEASACFLCGLSDVRQRNILAYLAAQEAIAVGSEADGDVTRLRAKANCWVCLTPAQLKALQIYLRCHEVDTGDITL